MTNTTATELKNALWETLQAVRTGNTTPQAGLAIASLARENLRAVKMQLAVFDRLGQKPSGELREFALGAGDAEAAIRAIG